MADDNADAGENGLEGKTEIGERVGLVADLLAHRLLGDAAEQIASEIQGTVKPGSVLVVEDRAIAHTAWYYPLVKWQIGEQRKEINEQEKAIEEQKKAIEKARQGETPVGKGFVGPLSAVTSAVVGAGNLLAAAATVAGMFRSNYSVKSRDVNMSTTPLISAMASALVAHGIGVAVDGFDYLEKDELLEELTTVSLERWKLASDIQQLKSLLSEKNKEDKEILAIIVAAEAAVSRFDAFVAAITTPQKEGEPSILVQALLNHAFRGSTNIRYVLYLSADAASGEIITRQTKLGGQPISCMGGVQVSYLLLDTTTHRTVKAGTSPFLSHIRYEPKDGRVYPATSVDLRSEAPKPHDRESWQKSVGNGKTTLGYEEWLQKHR